MEKKLREKLSHHDAAVHSKILYIIHNTGREIQVSLDVAVTLIAFNIALSEDTSFRFPQKASKQTNISNNSVIFLSFKLCLSWYISIHMLLHAPQLTHCYKGAD